VRRLSAVLLGLFVAAPAAAAEYRQLELTDGRVVVAEVVESTGTGLRVRTPQGGVFLRYEQVLALEDVDQAAYDSQAPWRVAVIPLVSNEAGFLREIGPATRLLNEHVAGFDHVDLVGTDELTAALGADGMATLQACGIDPGCATPLAQTADLTLLLMGELVTEDDGTRALLLASAYADHPRAQRVVRTEYAADAAQAAAQTLGGVFSAFHLDPDADRIAAAASAAAASVAMPEPVPEPIPVEPVAEPEPQPDGETEAAEPIAEPSSVSVVPEVGERASRALAFVPIPGFPSLLSRDLPNFGYAWVAVVPATAAVVYVSGRASSRRGQFLLMSVAGYYGVTVAANQILGTRTLALSAAPAAEGGVVQMTVEY